ncbi:MAG TPA: hypothetical protein RMG48_11415 [Myxococcales bacterium LLY-WYZ-16_1]|jgi:hypothetical protein|nr:hypothetical protein [Myxococcales bacterium LLY-WYZ-16_1]
MRGAPFSSSALSSNEDVAPIPTIDEVRERTVRRRTLHWRELWEDPAPLVWRANRLEGIPSFYPIYRWRDHHSTSILPLLRLAESLDPNKGFLARANRWGFRYASGSDTVDREIERVGGPPPLGTEITLPTEFAHRLADALVEDAIATEARHPDTTNVVLVGGKDSLNLLLLPWSHRTVAVSGPPNDELARAFVADNGLDVEVWSLMDQPSAAHLEREVLENACRLALEHCRWGSHLVEIARSFERKVLFWVGQAGGFYQTPKWRRPGHPPDRWETVAKRLYDGVRPKLPSSWDHRVVQGWLLPTFRHNLWRRAAMWQGTHMSFMRGLTDCLFVSSYHGPKATRVLEAVDLEQAVRFDVRPLIGRRLLGTEVRYPETNPGPPLSLVRRGLCRADRFLAAARAAGIPVGPHPR